MAQAGPGAGRDAQTMFGARPFRIQGLGDERRAAAARAAAVFTAQSQAGAKSGLARRSPRSSPAMRAMSASSSRSDTASRFDA